jgi:hypothetical protein
MLHSISPQPPVLVAPAHAPASLQELRSVNYPEDAIRLQPEARAALRNGLAEWVNRPNDAHDASTENRHEASARIQAWFEENYTAEDTMESEPLDLDNLGLTDLPDAMNLLWNLGHLDVSGNRLQVLPQVFPELSTLHTLDLSHNYDLTPQALAPILNLENLRSLYLSPSAGDAQSWRDFLGAMPATDLLLLEFDDPARIVPGLLVPQGNGMPNWAVTEQIEVHIDGTMRSLEEHLGIEATSAMFPPLGAVNMLRGAGAPVA